MDTPEQAGNRALRGLLGPVHVTVRGIHWLSHSPNMTYPKDEVSPYTVPIGRAACNPVAHAAANHCSTEDVRAMSLGLDYALIFMPPSSHHGRYIVRPIHKPTCAHCQVLLDNALANPMPKDGTYPVLLKQDTPWDGHTRYVYVEYVTKKVIETPPLVLPGGDIPWPK